MLTSAKLGEPWYKKIHFLKLNMCVYLLAEFEVSSIIPTSFKKGRGEREGVILPLPPPQNELLKSLPRLGLERIKSILIHEYQHKSTRVNMNQHESTRINMSPTRINTNQHESIRVRHESTRVRHESTPFRHESTWINTSLKQV